MVHPNHVGIARQERHVDCLDRAAQRVGRLAAAIDVIVRKCLVQREIGSEQLAQLRPKCRGYIR